jgi:hypothetical protein
MTANFNYGFLAGLGAVVGLFSGLIFLVALVIVQPLDMDLLPRRRWMHRVTIEWALSSFGLFVFCVTVFWYRMRAVSETAPQRPDQREDGAGAPRVSGMAQEVEGRVWVCAFGASRLGRELQAEGDEAEILEVHKRYRLGDTIERSEFPCLFILKGGRAAWDIMMGHNDKRLHVRLR